MREDTAAAPVKAERLGPGQFLLDVEELRVGVALTVDSRAFTVVSKPVVLGTMNYLATVRETDGPEVGRQLTVQLRLGFKHTNGPVAEQ